MIPTLQLGQLGRSQIVGGPTGKLDNYLANVWALYSCIYLLRTAYAGGPLFRVRRSSDNAEQDIGHDGVGLVDFATLLAFTGAGSGFVVTKYDQSGNANHRTQTTAALQPRIVNAGVFDKAETFDGVDDFMATPTIPSGSGRTVLCTYTGLTIPAVASGVLVEFGAVYTANSAIWLFAADVTGPPNNLHGSRWLTGDGTNRADTCVGGTAGNTAYYFDIGSGERHSVALIFDRTQPVNADQIKTVTQDGLLATSPGPNVTSPIPSNDFDASVMNIGARNGASVFLAVGIQNLVVYTAAKSTADMAAACALIPLYT